MRFLALTASLMAIACGPPPMGSGGGRGGSSRDAGVVADTGGENDGGSDVQDVGSLPNEDAGSVAPDSPLVDPQCLDGQYREVLPTPEAEIGQVVAAYSASNWRGYVEQILRRRYALGWTIITEALINGPEQLGDCMNHFVRSTASAALIDRQIGTFVHECGHFLDIGIGWATNRNVYFLRPDLTISCNQGDSTARRGRTFARSRIRQDDYSALRPPCGGGGGNTCDTYADTYLDGDPDDADFQSGDQGFNMLLEEAFQYVNSLATNYALNDRYSGSISGKDGILTHLWWVQRYLRMARQDYPDAHAFILGDPCWRQAILTLWGRAWLYLGLTEEMTHLGIRDGLIRPLIDDVDLMAEIEAVREAQGCN
jgi:hypothetical protein